MDGDDINEGEDGEVADILSDSDAIRSSTPTSTTPPQTTHLTSIQREASSSYISTSHSTDDLLAAQNRSAVGEAIPLIHLTNKSDDASTPFSDVCIIIYAHTRLTPDSYILIMTPMMHPQPFYS